jgi:hypothetical protein
VQLLRKKSALNDHGSGSEDEVPEAAGALYAAGSNGVRNSSDLRRLSIEWQKHGGEQRQGANSAWPGHKIGLLTKGVVDRRDAERQSSRLKAARLIFVG